MANNFTIGVNFAGNLGNLPAQTAAAAASLNGLGDAANSAGASLMGMGNAGEHAFDEIAAGAAAMARIEAAINAAAAAARDASQFIGGIGHSAVQAITPLATLEARLQEIRDGIGRAGTIQGAAQLGVQFDIVNRNLQETQARINAAITAAVGLSRAFNTVATATNSTGAAMNRLAPAIRPVLTNLTVIPPAAAAAGNSLARLRGQSGQAGAALTDVSRIIQDAPFGIIGIGNNITQLSESFGRLRATAGSTGAAFRQLFTSAGGFGGIGLAISVITTAVTFASVGFSAWTRGMGASKKAAEEAKKATDEFVKSLKGVDSIIGQATGSVQGQIVQVQTLASVVTNANNSYEQRKRALQELQQINKAYFGDLKLEESQMGALTSSVEEYTKALANQAIVKGFENEISRVSTELFTQETALKKFEKTFLIAKSRLSTSLINIGDTEKTREGLAGLVVETEEAEKAFVDQSAAVKSARGNLDQLIVGMKQAIVTGLGFADMTNTTTKATKAEDATLKALRKELAGYERQLKVFDELRRKGRLGIQQENDALELQLKIFDTLGKIDAREVAIKAKPDLEINPQLLDLQIDEAIQEAGVRSASKPFITVIRRIKPTFVAEFSPADAIQGDNLIPDDAFDKVIQAIRDKAKVRIEAIGPNLRDAMIDTVAKSLQDGLIQAADVLGSSLGDIFSGDFGEGIANAASGFLGIIGNVLTEVGKQIVITSTLIAALKKALNGIFGPGGEVISAGVGFALIGLGAILKNIKIPAFAGGVNNFSGGLALVGERGPELVNLPRGSDVIPNNQIGMFGQSQMNLRAVLRGEDIYLAYNQASNRRSRI